jgi:superfamily II DNA/RNA helicase
MARRSKRSRGLDILVATPGRLEDHLDTRAARLAETEVFVLDEADRMLDLGFVKAIRRIAGSLPKRRQNIFSRRRCQMKSPRSRAAFLSIQSRSP